MEDKTPSTQSPPENWFPYTKLQPPQHGATFVTRPRLQAILDDAVRRHKVTLVAAPAGSGKTILASTLAQNDLATAWIALDPTDDDLPIFVALLATALRHQLEDEGQAILSFLRTVHNVHEKTAQLVTILINNLSPAAQSPFILILDDYHAITDSAIHQYLAYLLDYLPPSLRLVITTRHDPPLPLPRLRARGHLAEIRLPQLHFDEAETAVFLNQRHQLSLTSEEVAALQQQTEGWIAGLQLLATTLMAFQGSDARSRYIHQLSAANRSIFDLLAAEVLAHQPQDMQEFLLQTAILPQLTPEKCRMVTANPAAPRLLAAAYRRNLFLSALTPDAQDGPFRYHDLFRSFLQQRLKEEQPEQWPELHRRAAQTAVSDEQKLHHLASAELWDEAARLLEKMGQLDTERRFTRRSVVAGIEGLPDTVRQAHPWLLLFVGQYYAIRGQAEAAAPWLAQAAARFQEEGDELGEIEILAASAMTDTLNTVEIVNAFRQKITTAGHLLRPDQWSIYHAAEQWHAIAIQDWSTLTTHLRASVTRALQSGDPGALTMTNLSIGPHMLFNEGGWPWLKNLPATVCKRPVRTIGYCKFAPSNY
jgi:LuxR family maltose regulon positive regulatory protein